MKLKKILWVCLSLLIVLLCSCGKKEYYVTVPAEMYIKIMDKTVYADKKVSIQLMPQTSTAPANTITEISCYKEYSPLLKNIFEENKSVEFETDPLISQKKAEKLLSKNLLYPCLKFDENMPLVIDSALMESNKEISYYRFNEIPQGYIALPYTESAVVSGLSDLRAINAIYPDNAKYPFYEKTIAVCKSLIPAKNENKKNYIKLSNITFDWFKNNFYRQFYASEKNRNIFFSACTGDIMIARGVEDRMLIDKKPDAVFNSTLKVLQHNDFTMGNLEGVVTNRWDAAIKTYTFKFKKKALQYLKDAGYDYFMLTNNHSYDYGEVGFKDTLSALKEYDFKYSGAGYNLEEAQKMYSTELKGTKISVLSVGAYPVEQSGFNGFATASAQENRAGILWKSQAVYDAVKEAKAKGDFVIINAHAGNEYVKNPSAVQKDFYTKLCDSGADVIFGSHPHILQKVEWYKDSLIVWSLGNFVFPGMEEMPGAEDSMIIRIGVVDGRLLYYQKYPAKLNDKTVDLK